MIEGDRAIHKAFYSKTRARPREGVTKHAARQHMIRFAMIGSMFVFNARQGDR
jgi:hypothetical protein